jgi:hypothetical protein
MLSFFVGIDYSMTCPAITVLPAGSPLLLESCQVGYLSKKKPPKDPLPNIHAYPMEPFEHDTERFHLISEWAVDFIKEKTYGDVHIFVEDYAFGAKGKVFEIGENGGMLKHKLWDAGYKFTCVPPTVVKKFASGSGAAKKEAMYDAFKALTGADLKSMFQPKKAKIDSPLGDIVDSFFICAYGSKQLA